MENTSRALEIAAGVLIAMMIIAIGTYLFQNIRRMEMAKDDVVALENQAEFNQTWLAYNKTLMYGTDVLSCLNKAQNNNQRYVYNNYYGTDSNNIDATARAEHFIDVTIIIRSDLREDIKVYYKDKSGVNRRVVGLAADNGNFSDQIFNPDYISGSGKNEDRSTDYWFKLPTVYYYYFNKGRLYQDEEDYDNAMWPKPAATMSTSKTLFELMSVENTLTGFRAKKSTPTKEPEPSETYQEILADANHKGYTEYHLLENNNDTVAYSDGESKKESAKLSALLSTVNLMEGTILNNPRPTSLDDTDWYSATWKTAAYDFKTRKFKCYDMHYNEVTGYIDRISFIELTPKDLY